MKTRLDLGTLGIITGEEKRLLERYVDMRLFRQRKNFDEYYIDATNYEIDIDLVGLMVLAEKFRVIVLNNSIIITDV